MSIFITNLAFAGDSEVINAAKIAILLASITAGTLGRESYEPVLTLYKKENL